MTSVLVPIADGTEEMEAVIAVDVLRRSGAEVCVASIMGDRMNIQASRGVQIEADRIFAECLDVPWDMIVLSGGVPGAKHMQQCDALINLIQNQFDRQKWVAAICAAPALVLGENGFLSSFTATGHPNFYNELADYANHLSDKAVVVDRNLVTSQGPGTAMQFALTLVAVLFSKEKAMELAKEMVTNWQP